MKKEKELTISFHPSAIDDIKKMSEEDWNKFEKALDEGDVSEPQPVDFEKMKKEEPELYEELMKRINNSQKSSCASKEGEQ